MAKTPPPLPPARQPTHRRRAWQLPTRRRNSAGPLPNADHIAIKETTAKPMARVVAGSRSPEPIKMPKLAQSKRLGQDEHGDGGGGPNEHIANVELEDSPPVRWRRRRSALRQPHQPKTHKADKHAHGQEHGALHKQSHRPALVSHQAPVWAVLVEWKAEVAGNHGQNEHEGQSPLPTQSAEDRPENHHTDLSRNQGIGQETNFVPIAASSRECERLTVDHGDQPGIDGPAEDGLVKPAAHDPARKPDLCDEDRIEDHGHRHRTGMIGPHACGALVHEKDRHRQQHGERQESAIIQSRLSRRRPARRLAGGVRRCLLPNHGNPRESTRPPESPVSFTPPADGDQNIPPPNPGLASGWFCSRRRSRYSASVSARRTSPSRPAARYAAANSNNSARFSSFSASNHRWARGSRARAAWRRPISRRPRQTPRAEAPRTPTVAKEYQPP